MASTKGSKRHKDAATYTHLNTTVIMQCTCVRAHAPAGLIVIGPTPIGSLTMESVGRAGPAGISAPVAAGISTAPPPAAATAATATSCHHTLAQNI
jgi:hypothetical protein